MASSQPPTAPARRRRRGGPARRAILDATQALLLDGGLEAVSIRRVSARSGYTAPTIYHHFGDKTRLIEAVLEEGFAEVFRVMSAIPRGEDPARYLRETARAFIAFALEHPDHYRLLNTPRSGREGSVPAADASTDLVRGALAELLREGSLATSDLDQAFQILWAMLHGMISLHLQRPDRYRLDDALVDASLRVMERGLLGREGV